MGHPLIHSAKKQATVEIATYRSEYTAACTCVEHVIDLRLSLRYLGVPIEKSSYGFKDNESCVNTSLVPHGELQKRHLILSYHHIREAIISNTFLFHNIPEEINPANIVSKHWGYSQIWPLLKYILFWEEYSAELIDPKDTTIH